MTLLPLIPTAIDILKIDSLSQLFGKINNLLLLSGENSKLCLFIDTFVFSSKSLLILSNFWYN